MVARGDRIRRRSAPPRGAGGVHTGRRTDPAAAGARVRAPARDLVREPGDSHRGRPHRRQRPLLPAPGCATGRRRGDRRARRGQRIHRPGTVARFTAAVQLRCRSTSTSAARRPPPSAIAWMRRRDRRHRRRRDRSSIPPLRRYVLGGVRQDGPRGLRRAARSAVAAPGRHAVRRQPHRRAAVRARARRVRAGVRVLARAPRAALHQHVGVAARRPVARARWRRRHRGRSDLRADVVRGAAGSCLRRRDPLSLRHLLPPPIWGFFSLNWLERNRYL